MYNSSSARRLVAVQLTPQALTLVEQGTASFVLPNYKWFAKMRGTNAVILRSGGDTKMLYKLAVVGEICTSTNFGER